MSAAQGRFTSPDKPFIDQFENDPQSWNLYGYVRNNPLTFVDPNGEDCIYTNDFASNGTVTVETGSCSKKGGTFVDGTIDTKSITYDRRNNSLGYSYSNDAAGTGGAGTLGLPSSGPGDLSSYGQGFYNEMSRRRDASNQFIGTFMVSSAAVGATGGAVAYFSGATSGSGLTTLGLRSGHGAFRLAVRGFSEADVALTKTGNVLKQADGAKVFIKELGGGKFNVIVEGEHGVVTAIKNISQKSLERLATRYGWK
jgi:hypothetical protein